MEPATGTAGQDKSSDSLPAVQRGESPAYDHGAKLVGLTQAPGNPRVGSDTVLKGPCELDEPAQQSYTPLDDGSRLAKPQKSTLAQLATDPPPKDASADASAPKNKRKHAADAESGSAAPGASQTHAGGSTSVSCASHTLEQSHSVAGTSHGDGNVRAQERQRWTSEAEAWGVWCPVNTSRQLAARQQEAVAAAAALLEGALRCGVSGARKKPKRKPPAVS